jgi:hypothetical protein
VGGFIAALKRCRTPKSHVGESAQDDFQNHALVIQENTKENTGVLPACAMFSTPAAS